MQSVVEIELSGLKSDRDAVSAVLCPQLVQRVHDVRLHGRWRQGQLRGDLLPRVSERDERQDLTLAGGQHVAVWRPRTRGALVEPVGRRKQNDRQTPTRAIIRNKAEIGGDARPVSAMAILARSRPIALKALTRSREENGIIHRLARGASLHR